MTTKRKREDDDDNDSGVDNVKRLCKSTAAGPSDSTTVTLQVAGSSKGKSVQDAGTLAVEPAKPPIDSGKKGKQPSKIKRRNVTVKAPLKPKPKIIKLTPNRPYPTVPTSSNATGPKSKRKEGNNKICVTRRTELGAYLKRCKDVLVKQGFKEIHLAAMGAAIPHAVMLATSLPAVLPYDRREIKTSIMTGSVSVMDEVIPIDEDDEGGTQTRRKASVEIIIRIVPGEGMDIDTSNAAIEYDSFSD